MYQLGAGELWGLWVVPEPILRGSQHHWHHLQQHWLPSKCNPIPLHHARGSVDTASLSSFSLQVPPPLPDLPQGLVPTIFFTYYLPKGSHPFLWLYISSLIPRCLNLFLKAVCLLNSQASQTQHTPTKPPESRPTPPTLPVPGSPFQ